MLVLQLIQNNYIPAFLYGLEVCRQNKADVSSPYFVVSQFFEVVLYSIYVVQSGMSMFGFKLSSEQRKWIIHKYDIYVMCEILYVHI